MKDGGPPLRILVVEDEAVNRALLRAVLGSGLATGLGRIEVRETESLLAAKAALADQPPDVVILDVRLPDGNGLQLLDEIAPRGEPGRPFVIVMSASVLPADRDAASRSGGDAFLGKPFMPADLIALLDATAR